MKQGKGYSGQHLSLKILKNNIDSNSFSIVVSKKVIGSAVKRNLLKKRVYSIIGGLLPSLPSGGIIFFARKGVDKLSYQALKSEIIALLKDSDFYKK